MTDNVVSIDIDGDEDGIDGCDVEFHDAKATPDEELPMAVGGIAIEDEGEDTCGCDIEFDDMDATPDDELPAAEGGT